MCRILPAPRLEHNPLHAELSVTSSALTSSDKSVMRLFNPSVRQAHLTAPLLHSKSLSWLRGSDVFPALDESLKCSCESPEKLPSSNLSTPRLFASIPAVGIATAHADDSPDIVKEP